MTTDWSTMREMDDDTFLLYIRHTSEKPDKGTGLLSICSLTLILGFLCFITSCMARPECRQSMSGKAKIVAFKQAKHSHMWVELVGVGTIHDFGSLGGRRALTVPLGTIVDIQYCIKGDRFEVILDTDRYVEYTSGDSDFDYLPGYDYLY